MMRGLALAGVACVAVAVPAAGQGLALRFDPPQGAQWHRLFQIHTRILVRDSVTSVREVAELGGLRELVVGGARGEPVVHLSVDSLRTRVREGRGAWHEVTGRSDSAWVQARLDERLHAEVLGTGGAAGAARMLELVTGLPALVLPERRVAPGTTWQADLVFDRRHPGGLTPITDAAGVVLVARATVRVDSLVVRPRDTLAYLSVTGHLAPASGDLPDGVRYTGGLSAELVWSTAWHAFVSGATRTRIEVRYGRPTAAGPGEGVLRMDTTIRQQVRP